jgi:hypothetical protein
MLKYMMVAMCVAAILCSGQGVLAQTIFKQINAAGHTVAGDRPAVGAPVGSYPTNPNQNRDSSLRSPIAHGTAPDMAKPFSSSSAKILIDAATIDFNEATRRLKLARRNRQAGMELWPGERAESARVSALAKRYQRRQRKLEQEVVAAELRANETALIRSDLLERFTKLDRPKLTQR